MTDHGKTQNIVDYASRVARHVPGLHDMHRMAGLLLGEHVPSAGRVLVLGAGGGLELRSFAEMQPGWQFVGVDPSAEMIAQARLTLGALNDRVTICQGYIDDAPDGPFDGATCLLTLHFLPVAERLRTLQGLARRLKKGAPLVIVHHSTPDGAARDLWLQRNAAWLVSGGTPPGQAAKGMEAIKARLPVLTPQDDEALLAEAGFTDIQLFFAAFTFRGWVCYRR